MQSFSTFILLSFAAAFSCFYFRYRSDVIFPPLSSFPLTKITLAAVLGVAGVQRSAAAAEQLALRRSQPSQNRRRLGIKYTRNAVGCRERVCLPKAACRLTVERKIFPKHFRNSTRWTDRRRLEFFGADDFRSKCTRCRFQPFADCFETVLKQFRNYFVSAETKRSGHHRL